MDSYLTFHIGTESFALHVKNVLNILEMCKITHVPRMPEFVKGVINLRGEVLPVIDSRMKFGMDAIEITKNTCILVLEIDLDSQKTRLGILVDNVSEVLEVEETNIKEPPTIGARYKNEFVTGMIENEDKFTMILDIDKIFTADEIIQLKVNEQEVVTD